MNSSDFDISQPLNAKALDYLYRSRFRRGAPIFGSWDSIPDSYVSCGCHPDIVGLLWDFVNPKLPSDCRGLVYGCPALVHAETGVIFAIGMGTWHGFRLPGALGIEALKDGVKTFKDFGYTVTDIQSNLGEDWYFGCLPSTGGRCSDDAWCQLAYEMLARKDGIS